MKVAQPPLAPVPERKPDSPPSLADGAGGESSFRDALVQTNRPGTEAAPVGRPANGRLQGGQKAPPLPAAKPPAPILLTDGTQVPFPAAKPVTPIRLADGTVVPLPAVKPPAVNSETPVMLANSAPADGGAAAPRAPLPGLKPAAPVVGPAVAQGPTPSSKKVAETVKA